LLCQFVDFYIALSDIHGALPEMINTLIYTKVLIPEDDEVSLKGFSAIDFSEIKNPGSFKKFFTLSCKNRVIVFCGDYINRGAYSKEVIDLIFFLETEAFGQKGAKVVSLLGNHEIILLNGKLQKRINKNSAKAQAYIATLKSFQRSSLFKEKDLNSVVSPENIYGKWFQTRPIAARVGDVFFIHAGIDPGYSVFNSKNALFNELESKFTEALEKGVWDKKILFSKYSPKNSSWFEDAQKVDSMLKGLDCRYIVFGHDPGAINRKGLIGSFLDRVFNIDVGMTPSKGYSSGGALIIKKNSYDKRDFWAVESLRPDKKNQATINSVFEERLMN
jgi:hypothetical protein